MWEETRNAGHGRESQKKREHELLSIQELIVSPVRSTRITVPLASVFGGPVRVQAVHRLSCVVGCSH